MWAKEQKEIAEVNSLNQSDLESLVPLKFEQKNIGGQTKIQNSFSYFVPQNNFPGKIEPE